VPSEFQWRLPGPQGADSGPSHGDPYKGAHRGGAIIRSAVPNDLRGAAPPTVRHLALPGRTFMRQPKQPE
jgi:hypothetical protein